MLDLSESYIDSLRIAQEEDTELPSVPSYSLDSWAIEYWNSINGINSALQSGVNSNIIIGNLNGTTLLEESSDPRFPYSGTNDSTLSSEIVSTDPLYTMNPYQTYGQEDVLKTDQLNGLYNKGQGNVFYGEVTRPANGDYGSTLKMGERRLMVCGFQVFESSTNATPKYQASSPTNVPDAIELNLIENGAKIMMGSAAALLAVSASIAF